jgi:hypothetical protein
MYFAYPFSFALVFQLREALINATLALAEHGSRKVSCSTDLQTTGCNGPGGTPSGTGISVYPARLSGFSLEREKSVIAWVCPMWWEAVADITPALAAGAVLAARMNRSANTRRVPC